MKFNVQSKDVIHDFWIPDFRMKIDAVPGITTSYRVTPKSSAIGDHEIVCAELCGLGHAFMRQTAHIVSSDAFAKWTQKVSAGGAAAGGRRRGAGGAAAAGGAKPDGKALFTAGNADTGATACGSCHTLAAAGTNGTTGPNLDKAIAKDPAAAIKEMIVNPDKEIAAGFQKGIMPPNYGDTLSGAQVDALVQYLVKSTHK